MRIPRIYKVTLWIQGSYTLLTALWGIIDIDSFMVVTGPKNDIWLVKTVSVVLVAIGLCLLIQGLSGVKSIAVMVLAFFSSLGLAFVDIYYATRDVISNVYLADAFIQILLLFTWAFLLYNHNKVP